MQYQNRFPIYRDATNLVIEIENAVKNFPKYHKYTIGSEMRTVAYDLLIAITYGINNKNNRLRVIKKSHNFSEVLKIKIHLAKNITNMSFKLFENLASMMIVISKQCKAWQKQMQHYVAKNYNNTIAGLFAFIETMRNGDIDITGEEFLSALNTLYPNFKTDS